MNIKEDGSWSESLWIVDQKYEKTIHGVTKDLGDGEHGETLFSTTFKNPQTGKDETQYGANKISYGAFKILKFNEVGQGDKSIKSISDAL